MRKLVWIVLCLIFMAACSQTNQVQQEQSATIGDNAEQSSEKDENLSVTIEELAKQSSKKVQGVVIKESGKMIEVSIRLYFEPFQNEKSVLPEIVAEIKKVCKGLTKHLVRISQLSFSADDLPENEQDIDFSKHVALILEFKASDLKQVNWSNVSNDEILNLLDDYTDLTESNKVSKKYCLSGDAEFSSVFCKKKVWKDRFDEATATSTTKTIVTKVKKTSDMVTKVDVRPSSYGDKLTVDIELYFKKRLSANKIFPEVVDEIQKISKALKEQSVAIDLLVFDFNGIIVDNHGNETFDMIVRMYFHMEDLAEVNWNELPYQRVLNLAGQPSISKTSQYIYEEYCGSENGALSYHFCEGKPSIW